ncbi:MAG: hypothetical protein WCQ50_13460, partial [Spirochaetota bacterium]
MTPRYGIAGSSTFAGHGYIEGLVSTESQLTLTSVNSDNPGSAGSWEGHDAEALAGEFINHGSTSLGHPDPIRCGSGIHIVGTAWHGEKLRSIVEYYGGTTLRFNLIGHVPDVSYSTPRVHKRQNEALIFLSFGT